MLVGMSKPKEGIVEGKLCMSMILEMLDARFFSILLGIYFSSVANLSPKILINMQW